MTGERAKQSLQKIHRRRRATADLNVDRDNVLDGPAGGIGDADLAPVARAGTRCNHEPNSGIAPNRTNRGARPPASETAADESARNTAEQATDRAVSAVTMFRRTTTLPRMSP